MDTRGSKYPFTRFFHAMTVLKALRIVVQNNDKGPRKRENFCEPLSIYVLSRQGRFYTSLSRCFLRSFSWSRTEMRLSIIFWLLSAPLRFSCSILRAAAILKPRTLTRL